MPLCPTYVLPFGVDPCFSIWGSYTCHGGKGVGDGMKCHFRVYFKPPGKYDMFLSHVTRIYG